MCNQLHKWNENGKKWTTTLPVITESFYLNDNYNTYVKKLAVLIITENTREKKKKCALVAAINQSRHLQRTKESKQIDTTCDIIFCNNQFSLSQYYCNQKLTEFFVV